MMAHAIQTHSGLSSLSKRWATMLSNSKRLWSVLLILPAALFCLFMPALFVFLFLLALSFVPRNRNLSLAINALNATLLFGWMNVEKFPTNDWAWYTTHYKWLQSMPLSSYLGGVFRGGLEIRRSEPVYHTLSAVVSRLSDGSVAVLAFVVTVVIYGSVATGIALLVRARVKSPYEAMLITWVPLTIGVTFTLTAQLVRQQMAASLLFMGLTLLWTKNRVLGGTLVGLALLTHNSVIFPALCILLAASIVLKTKLHAPVLLGLVFLIGTTIGGLFIISPFGETYYDSQMSDGTVSTFVYLMDLTIFAALVFFRHKLSELDRLTMVLVASVLAYAGFILVMSFAPLLLLRMYFYMDFFRVVMLVLVVQALIRLKNGWLWGPPLALASLFYVEARIAVSPFYFHGGVIAHLLRPFAFFQ
jgi:hypothetical protein